MKVKLGKPVTASCLTSRPELENLTASRKNTDEWNVAKVIRATQR